jgi:Glycosyl hydrolase catalytic core
MLQYVLWEEFYERLFFEVYTMRQLNHKAWYFCSQWGIIFVLLLCVTACTQGLPTAKIDIKTLKASLPGQQIWKDHTSSFLFGTNDTYEWSTHNIQTEASIQQALHSAGFTLIRSFFPDAASDVVIEKRISTIEQSGAHCLGVITNIFNTTFNQHLVSYLGNRCQMYEFGNESDYNNISIQSYLQQWNKQIPLFRSLNPQAIFIGPVTFNNTGKNDFMYTFLQGVKTSDVLPDAISFHWYPCYKDTQQDCLNSASSVAQEVGMVRALVKSTLGKDLPIGISEWNYDPENPPPNYGDNAAFMTTFTTNALLAMAQAGVTFACQFDAASFAGYGRLDMFDVTNNAPKPQYYAIKSLIHSYQL